MKHYFHLDCFYTYKGELERDREAKLFNLAGKFRGMYDGGGCNFKIRDMCYIFETFPRTKRFYQEAKKRRLIEGADISITNKDGDSATANIKEFLG